MKFLRRWAEQGRRARRLARARELRAADDLPGALAELEAAAAEEPHSRPILQDIAETAAELGDTARAVAALSALLDEDIAEIAFLRNAALDGIRGDPLFRGVYETAIRQLRRRLETTPDDFAAAFRLAETLEMAGEPEGAHALYNRLAEEGSAEVQVAAAYANARLWAAASDPAQSAEWLRRVLEGSPAHVDVYNADPAFDTWRATPEFIAIREQAADRAIAALREAVAATPDNPTPWRNLIEALHAQGKIAETVETAQEAVERFPADVALAEQRANALFRAERYEEAMPAYDEVVRLDPNHAWALCRTGLLYERAGRVVAAREAWWDALRAVRSEADIALAVAEGFARQGDRAGALEAATRAVALAFAGEGLDPARLREALERGAAFAELREDAEFLSLLAGLRDSDEAPDEAAGLP
jgi:tetratricopeptide (TPR) repeat protein